MRNMSERLNEPKMTKAEAGRLGGKIGGKLSKGGGRPPKYNTDEERKAARVAQTQAWRRRKKEKTVTHL